MRRVGSGRMRKGLIALATVILAAVTTISVAAPASADPFGQWCFRWNGQKICVPVSINWDWRFQCPQCGMAVDWLPDPGQVVGRQIALGLGDLSNARLAPEPQRGQLRARAFDEFTQAAVYAGVRPFVGQVGFMNESGTVNAGPQPVPWLQASAQDIAAGIGYIQLALNDWTGGGGAAYRQAAVAKLDEAYAELANAQVIGG